MKLENEELKGIKGGTISACAIAGIVGAIVFISGIIDGIARPGKCN